jgi:hypothetical protein
LEKPSKEPGGKVKDWILVSAHHGFDLDHPRLDLVFREPHRFTHTLSGIPPEKKAISLRFGIGDGVSDAIRELRRVAYLLEKEIK